MDYAEAFKALEQARRDYAAYSAESRACGYEIESFEDWLGIASARERAESQWKRAEARDELDLH